MTRQSPVLELRVALTVENFDEAVRFYRDAMGLPVIEEWDRPEGTGIILAAGLATLELLSPNMTAYVDSVEVGHPASGPVRLALKLADSAKVAETLERAGGQEAGRPGDDALERPQRAA